MVLEQIKFFLLLSLLFSFIITQEEEIRVNIEPSTNIININYDSKTKSFKGQAENAFKEQRYKLNFFNTYDIPEYIKFELSSNDKTNKIISFTPEDNKGKNDRIQLAQIGIEDKVKTWINKNQLNAEYLYIVVECQILENQNCNYLIDINGEDNIELDSPNFNYYFYINKKNQQMKFKVLNDITENNEDKILSVYATGGKTIKVNVQMDSEEKPFYGEDILIGQALTTKIRTFEYYILTIDAEEGDYISLGGKIIIADEKPEMNALKSNGYQLSGFLKRNILDNECYLIYNDNIFYNKASFIVGLFYHKEGRVSYKDKEFNNIDEEPVTTTKGYYTYNYLQEDSNKKYICISFPDNVMDTLSYTLQFTQPGKQYGFSNLFVPQSNGNIYPRFLEKGSSAFFNGINLNSNSEEIIYNMIAKEGLPCMYIYKCDNYPICEFDENDDDIIKINDINLMSTWHNREKTSPIDAHQYVMFVNCEDLDENAQSNYCLFYTSIYGNLDKIFLIEGQTFSQYILKGQNSNYYIDISHEQNVNKIHLDILIINGDISLEIVDDSNKNIDYHKYILSNKIFYSIHLENNKNLKRIIANIKAKMNSYYIIEYKLVRTSDDESTNDIYTGINYLIPIPKIKDVNEKIIRIHNTQLLEDESYFTSFYSLNCKFEIFREEGNGNFITIQSYGNYGQDIKEINKNEMNEKIYSYKIDLIDDDKSSYNSDMCMLYVNSVELMNQQNYDLQKEILITEGIPQRINFLKGDYKIKYIYPNINKDKDVAIYFRVINSAKFSYTITYNHNEEQRDYLSQSKIVYIEQKKITANCKDDELCNMIVSIGLEEELQNDGNIPMIEISIREIGNIPYYIPIGVAKKDFLSGTNKLNLFTTLGKNDQGFITVDFARGSGMIYAKIVPIDGKEDENPEWRQYELPKTKDNTLKYDFYNKKILFKTENTKNCENGCYLLISIESSITGSFNENFRAHHLSITVNLIPQGELKSNGQIIQIQPEQYIIGSLTDKEKMKKKDMYEFYQLNIPFNAKTVEIDWQSDSSIFLLNIGQERPLVDSNFKKLESRSDTVFEITKREIIEQLESKNFTNNAYLTIGVYSDVLESPYGNSYSFRIHFTRNLNIYKVDSDQKTLCKPEKIDNEYRCLFMIIYEEFDFIYDTLIYAKSQSPSASIYMYGKFIENSIYDDYDEENLEKIIPRDKDSTYNTKREKIDFIFLTLSDLYSHFYLSVVSDKQDIIELISSFKTFDDELSPNPSSVQLFAVNNGPSINLRFRTTKPLFINIVSLYGSSKLHFQDNNNVEYFLRGRDDRISLAIPNDGNEENLIIENRNYISDDSIIPDKPKMPGIAFYLEYYLRSDNNINLDEIYLGKSSEIVYKKSDFPIYYYSKLYDINKDINIFFNFHDLELNSSTTNRMVKPNDLTIKANLVSQKTVYNIRTGEESKPNNVNSIEGKYDPALQAGYLFLSSDYLKKFINLENPTLYLSFEKNNNNNIFKNIRLELTVTEKNSEIPVTEKIYQYGNIKNNEIISYKLKIDNYTGDMRIQFAANSKNVDFSINNSPNMKENTTLDNLDKKEERGKLFLTFQKPKEDYIYLNVFAKDEKIDSRLNNYVFKYMNSFDRKNFFEYPILNNDGSIKINYEKSSSKVQFNRINKTNVDVTYSLKISKKWDKYQDELNKTIAFTDYSPTVMKVYNPSGEEINMEINNDEIDKLSSYLEVIAQIKDGPIIEYVAYDPSYEIKYSDDESGQDKSKKNEDDDDDEVLIIVISCVGGAILLILITLVIIVMIYNNKTKNLLQHVNKISFADAESKDKNENLLISENELK